MPDTPPPLSRTIPQESPVPARDNAATAIPASTPAPQPAIAPSPQKRLPFQDRAQEIHLVEKRFGLSQLPVEFQTLWDFPPKPYCQVSPDMPDKADKE